MSHMNRTSRPDMVLYVLNWRITYNWEQIYCIFILSCLYLLCMLESYSLTVHLLAVVGVHQAVDNFARRNNFTIVEVNSFNNVMITKHSRPKRPIVFGWCTVHAAVELSFTWWVISLLVYRENVMSEYQLIRIRVESLRRRECGAEM